LGVRRRVTSGRGTSGRGVTWQLSPCSIVPERFMQPGLERLTLFFYNGWNLRFLRSGHPRRKRRVALLAGLPLSEVLEVVLEEAFCFEGRFHVFLVVAIEVSPRSRTRQAFERPGRVWVGGPSRCVSRQRFARGSGV